ncbi:MAG TPA: radical SAM protein [Candidatus Hydrogenedentes bacterium]|nr:radical SAM protein [Candidatus Hydrogenedentota bacterium]
MHSAVPYHVFRDGYAFPAWHYFLEVTRRCNLRCAMCQYRKWFESAPGSEQREDELTTSEWRDVIGQTGRLSLITFTGGEPFVRDDLLELLEFASQLRRTHIITNGLRLTEDVAKRLVELAPANVAGRGLHFVGVSLEGPRDVHDAITGMAGAYDKAVQGLKALVRYRKESGKTRPLVHITAVIQQDNLGSLARLPAVATELGADALNLVTEIRMFDPENVGELDPDAFRSSDVTLPRLAPTALDGALQAAADAAAELGVAVRWPRMPRADLVQYYDGGLDLGEYACRAAWTNMYVAAKGDASSCLIHRAGNVRDKPLKAIWNGPEMRQWRQCRRRGLTCLCQGCCELEHKGNPTQAV